MHYSRRRGFINNVKIYGLIVTFTKNLGDDIQSSTTLQFLPRVDYVIHHEYMVKYMRGRSESDRE